MAVNPLDPNKIKFKTNLKYLSQDYDNMTDKQKMNTFYETIPKITEDDSVTDQNYIEDLKKVGPFKLQFLYEDDDE